MPVDYDALALESGATNVDYDALAKELGGASDASAATPQRNKRNEGKGRPPGPTDESFGGRFAEGMTRGLLEGPIKPITDTAIQAAQKNPTLFSASPGAAMGWEQLKSLPNLFSAEGAGSVAANLPYMLLGARVPPLAEAAAIPGQLVQKAGQMAPKVTASSKAMGKAAMRPRTGPAIALGGAGYAMGQPQLGAGAAAAATAIPIALEGIRAWRSTPPGLPPVPLRMPEPPPVPPHPMAGPTPHPLEPPPTLMRQGHPLEPPPVRPMPPNPFAPEPAATPPQAAPGPRQRSAVWQKMADEHPTVKSDLLGAVDDARVTAIRKADPSMTKAAMAAITDPAKQRTILIQADQARGIKTPRHTPSDVGRTWARLIEAFDE